MKVQWNPVDSDTKGTCHSVRIIAGCPKKSHGYIFYRHKGLCNNYQEEGGGGAEKLELSSKNLDSTLPQKQKN